MNTEQSRLLGVKEIAAALGVGPRTARRYIKSGLLEVTWNGGYCATPEAVERCSRELARRKIEKGRIG